MYSDAKRACLLAAWLALSACVARPVETVPAASGRQLAEQKCSGCHAIGLDDVSRNPDALALRTLYTRYPIDSLRAAFTKGMKVGHPDMPRFMLPPPEIDSLLVYLRTLDPCTKSPWDKAAMARCFEPMEP